MKYHIWKLGVVFTDNVSTVPEKNKILSPKSGDPVEFTENKQALRFLIAASLGNHVSGAWEVLGKTLPCAIV